MIRAEEITTVEQRSTNVLHIVVTEGLAENLQEVVCPRTGRRKSISIVECGMHVASLYVSPLISEGVGVDAVEVEALFPIPLESGNRVVLTLEQHVD